MPFIGLCFALAGCRHRPPIAAVNIAPDLAAWSAWSTLRSDHRVVVEVRDDGGRIQQRRLRGAVAVERPGHLRLRALGPGGITVFDLVFAGGEARVVEALRDPGGAAFLRLLPSIAGDLAAAFGLAPLPAGRSTRVEGDALVVEEPERRVRLGAFRPVLGGVAPTRITIESRRDPYRVEIEAADTEIGVALDPALFR